MEAPESQATRDDLGLIANGKGALIQQMTKGTYQRFIIIQKLRRRENPA